MDIAIDFDGVLSNTTKRWIHIFNKDYSAKYHNLKLSYNKIIEFDFYKYFDITHDDDSRQIFQTCWEQRNTTLEPTEFMLEQKTKTLSKMYDTVDIVTANNYSNKEY